MPLPSSFFRPNLRCRLLVVACALVVTAGSLRAEESVTAWGKSSPEYATWKFGASPVKNEAYVFAQGKFHGGTNRDKSLDKVSFLNVTKPLALDLVGQHYYPADSIQKAQLLIMVDWGVTTVSESLYEQMGRDSPVGVGDLDSSRRETSHQAAVAERASGRTTPSVQMLDQTYQMERFNGLNNDARSQEIDQKSASMGAAENATLLGFTDELRAEDKNGFDSGKGQTLRAYLADERYFVVLNAYDCQEYLKNKKLVLVWTARLSVRALGTDFPKGLAFMSKAGRGMFGHKTDGVEIKAARVEIGTPRTIPAAADADAK